MSKPLPPHLQTRVEKEAKKLEANMEDSMGVQMYDFKKGAECLWSILTEVSEDEEKAIEEISNELEPKYQALYYEAAHFGLALSRMKESKGET